LKRRENVRSLIILGCIQRGKGKRKKVSGSWLRWSSPPWASIEAEMEEKKGGKEHGLVEAFHGGGVFGIATACTETLAYAAQKGKKRKGQGGLSAKQKEKEKGEDVLIGKRGEEVNQAAVRPSWVTEREKKGKKISLPRFQPRWRGKGDETAPFYWGRTTPWSLKYVTN